MDVNTLRAKIGQFTRENVALSGKGAEFWPRGGRISPPTLHRRLTGGFSQANSANCAGTYGSGQSHFAFRDQITDKDPMFQGTLKLPQTTKDQNQNCSTSTVVTKPARYASQTGDQAGRSAGDSSRADNGPMTAEAINAATLALKKALIERALGGEMNHHLGYPPGASKPASVSNQRNGTGAKTILTDDGPIRIAVPRDRDGSFTPLLIPKHERRFSGFDDKIVAMYARGMTVREIQGFLLEQYATQVSPEFISSVTDEVMAEVAAWQARSLEAMYPVVFFDALRVKIREDAVVRNKAIYLALGVPPDGTREILGLWIENTEGAKFWMKLFNDLKTRGMNDILIAVTDGLKGMPEALAAVFPATTLQTCIVHLIRNSLDYASWKDRKALAAAIRPIYTVSSAEAAQAELDAFAQGPWEQRFPTISAA